MQLGGLEMLKLLYWLVCPEFLSQLREIGGITNHVSTFVLLGCKSWQFEGILPNSILCSKLVFDRDFSQNIFVAEAIDDDTLSPKSTGSSI